VFILLNLNFFTQIVPYKLIVGNMGLILFELIFVAAKLVIDKIRYS